jgi:hypothetical protein
MCNLFVLILHVFLPSLTILRAADALKTQDYEFDNQQHSPYRSSDPATPSRHTGLGSGDVRKRDFTEYQQYQGTLSSLKS